MTKISLEVATEEVNKWFENKKIKEKKRKAFEGTIANIVEAVSEGTFVINDDFSITHNLDFPLGAESQIKSLTYKSRLTVLESQKYLNGATGTDARLLAVLQALSGQPKGVIEKMDTEDFNVAASVALFFI